MNKIICTRVTCTAMLGDDCMCAIDRIASLEKEIAELKHENYIQFHSARYAKQEVNRLNKEMSEREKFLDDLWNVNPREYLYGAYRNVIRDMLREFSTKPPAPQSEQE